jgi:hypothetical protein
VRDAIGRFTVFWNPSDFLSCIAQHYNMNMCQKKAHIVIIDICMPLRDLRSRMMPFMDIIVVLGEFCDHHPVVSFGPLTETLARIPVEGEAALLEGPKSPIPPAVRPRR